MLCFQIMLSSEVLHPVSERWIFWLSITTSDIIQKGGHEDLYCFKLSVEDIRHFFSPQTLQLLPSSKGLEELRRCLCWKISTNLVVVFNSAIILHQHHLSHHCVQQPQWKYKEEPVRQPCRFPQCCQTLQFLRPVSHLSKYKFDKKDKNWEINLVQRPLVMRGTPPGKVISPWLECSMLNRLPPGWGLQCYGQKLQGKLNI